LTYVTLGALAGLMGMALNLAGALAGAQAVAAVLAGASMTAWGLVTLLRHAGVRISVGRAPQGLQKLNARLFRGLRGQSALVRAFSVGLLTTLLPCGWLYAFVVLAAGTGAPLPGLGVMVAFWLGSLPLLLAMALGVSLLSHRLQRHLPVATALALVVLGLIAVSGRAALPAAALLEAARAQAVGSEAHGDMSPVPVPTGVAQAAESGSCHGN
jgi:hypothetical protein